MVNKAGSQNAALAAQEAQVHETMVIESDLSEDDDKNDDNGVDLTACGDFHHPLPEESINDRLLLFSSELELGVQLCAAMRVAQLFSKRLQTKNRVVSHTILPMLSLFRKRMTVGGTYYKTTAGKALNAERQGALPLKVMVPPKNFMLSNQIQYRAIHDASDLCKATTKYMGLTLSYVMRRTLSNESSINAAYFLAAALFPFSGVDTTYGHPIDSDILLKIESTYAKRMKAIFKAMYPSVDAPVQPTLGEVEATTLCDDDGDDRDVANDAATNGTSAASIDLLDSRTFLQQAMGGGQVIGCSCCVLCWLVVQAHTTNVSYGL